TRSKRDWSSDVCSSDLARKKKVLITNDTTIAIASISRISFIPPKNPPRRFLGLRPVFSTVIVLLSPVHKSYPSESYPRPEPRTATVSRWSHSGCLPAERPYSGGLLL